MSRHLGSSLSSVDLFDTDTTPDAALLPKDLCFPHSFKVRSEKLFDKHRKVYLAVK